DRTALTGSHRTPKPFEPGKEPNPAEHDWLPPKKFTRKDPPAATTGTLGVEPFQNTVEEAAIGMLTHHFPELSHDEVLSLTFQGAIENWFTTHLGEEHLAHPLPHPNALYNLMRLTLMSKEARKHAWTLALI